MPKIEASIAPENTIIARPVPGAASNVYLPSGTDETAQKYHNSLQFTKDMSAAFKKAAEQAQIENQQLDESQR